MEEEDIAAAMGFSSFGGTKKRKYDQASSPTQKASSSGANSTRLGVRPKVSSGELPEASDMSTLAETNVVQSTEPCTNAKGKPKQPAANSLADFLSRGQGLPDKPPAPNPVSTPLVQDDESSPMVSFGGPSVSKSELDALRRGVRNERGDLVYFLPSFVEDPWEKLQQDQR
jgi:hypothetical protein